MRFLDPTGKTHDKVAPRRAAMSQEHMFPEPLNQPQPGHSLVFIGMGHDSANGRLELDPVRNCLVVKYAKYSDETIFSRISAGMEGLTAELGGTCIKNPRWSDLLGRNMTTVHPLGGCSMDGRNSEKVVNHLGQVHGHENLYAADGSILPTAVGVNPAFTISAVAERIAVHLAKKLNGI